MTGAALDGRARFFVAALALALVGSALLVDPQAQASFAAPQRLAALAGAGLALLALAWRPALPDWRQWPREAQIPALLLLAVLVLLLPASLGAAQPARAWDSLRGLLLFALFLPLGAAHGLDGRAGRWVAGIAVAAVVTNVLLSLAQAAGIALPLSLPAARLGGRFPTGALLGNEAYVAQAAALLGAGCVAVGIHVNRSTMRAAAAVLLLLCVAVIAASRQTTSAVALCVAAGLVVLLRLGLRRLAAAGFVLAAVLALAAAALPARAQGWAALPGISLQQAQELTTYRLGAWAAARQMIQARPWSGHGLGSYADQAQHWRLQAELAGHARLTPPPTATGFAQAHHEYLQFGAEAGLPALALLLAALALLLRGLFWRAKDDAEAAVWLAVLTAGAVAALAWFPLQVPFIAALLLLAAGRAWRLLARGADVAIAHCPAAATLLPESAASAPAAMPDSSPRGIANAAALRAGLLLLTALLLALALRPELARYRGERLLGAADMRLTVLLHGGLQGDAALAAARQALAEAEQADALLVQDTRAALARGIALILLRRAEEARTLLETAIARAERAELSLNLGRARAALGDDSGALRAYLRSAWASPASIASLPRALREPLQQQVAELEQQLREGRLEAVPPL